MALAIDINSVVVSGNLTADPRVVTREKNGQTLTFCDFSVAVNSGLDGNGEERPAHFFDVKTFGANAKACGEHLSKGRHVTLQGEMRLERWNDKETQEPRRKVVIAARQVKFGPKPQGNGAATAQVDEAPVETDDIPF
jgi:single-strand DNA-binding protein